ncbi:pyridoxamine 5'-phosphate oxidase [Hyphomicrobium nitrativorans NL23]|uniref:Pyridoxine/pyridoxamine 5'-phosphate oxidase n=1 Tax=Hyphomicrobium nitrativorans NL23 TaxID=1029756 RepID=V5SD22_9HYPH|nr:pyridoxamine 5'-phosphate oxidase [Hyphomicrobium nitrativorans]AHB48382.1 pyridoxamine 5'-phosphate oxidase [Hyphomicrobium nitrativorans NL23]
MTDDTEGADGEAFASTEDPFSVIGQWIDDATRSEINDPNAMALATVDPHGLPNVRMVLLKGLDGAEHPERGFVFYTNLESAKGKELAATPKAALLLHWKSLERQVRARGVVTPVTAEEADQYFASRPRLSRVGAWASDQSRPLESRFALEKKVGQFTAKFGIGDIPRPPHWSGFRLTPVEVELWHSRPFRLHDRVVFRRADPSAPWIGTRLYP